MKREERDLTARETNDADHDLKDFFWKELNADIGEALKHARERRNIVQARVADLMGVQQSRVSQIESTRGVAMTLDVLARYVAAIGYRLDVNIVDPETDELVSMVPVMPVPYMAAEEVEQRASITVVHRPLPRKEERPGPQLRVTTERFDHRQRKVGEEQLSSWSTIAGSRENIYELVAAA